MERLYTNCAKFHGRIPTIVCKGCDSKLTIWAICRLPDVRSLDELLKGDGPTEVLIARQYLWEFCFRYSKPAEYAGQRLLVGEGWYDSAPVVVYRLGALVTHIWCEVAFVAYQASGCCRP